MSNEMFYAALARSICRDIPPEDAYVTPEDDERLRLNAIYDDAYWECMEGKPCDFWPTGEWRSMADYPAYDNEQELRLFSAVKVAASLLGATDAERWGVVENALRAEAEKYAEYQRNRAAA